MPKPSTVNRSAAQRRGLLASFARNAITGLRAQRARLQVEQPAVYDLDYYAHSAYLLRETCRQAINRLGLMELKPALERFDDLVPNLKTYRDPMVHAVDDRLDHWAWFGSFAGRLLPGGDVEYLIDSRHDHDALERLFRDLIVVLEPDGPEGRDQTADESTTTARTRDSW